MTVGGAHGEGEEERGSQEVTAGVGVTSREGTTGRWGDGERGSVTAHQGKRVTVRGGGG